MLYVLTAEHGTGAGQALLDAVLDPAETAGLWVADLSSRARAFYGKNGFTADGATRVQDGIPTIRMTRAD